MLLRAKAPLPRCGEGPLSRNNRLKDMWYCIPENQNCSVRRGRRCGHVWLMCMALKGHGRCALHYGSVEVSNL